MNYFAYTDISFLNRLTPDSDGIPVYMFGWAIVIKTQEGLIGNIESGVETLERPSSVHAEAAAITKARKRWPGAIIMSDCAWAKGWDRLVDKNDPFHQVAHFASRSALYTRLFTAGHAVKGKLNTANKKLERQKIRALNEYDI